MIDLTHLESPRFDFKVTEPQKDGTDLIVEVSLDFDAIGTELQDRIPTAFLPSGEMYPTESPMAGHPKPGLVVVCESLMQGKALPSHLPNIMHVLDAAKKAFRIPERCGQIVVEAVFTAYLQEMSRRGELKKNGPKPQPSSSPVPSPSNFPTLATTALSA